MSRKLKPLVLRGLLACVFSVAAVSTAATQAVGYAGEVRFEQGRLVLVDAPALAAQCEAAAPRALLERAAHDS
jgi:hypothetical protein